MTTRQTIFVLRQITLAGLCLPALYLAWRWWTDDLGPRPVTLATHVTGDWTVVFLLLSLALTPARAIFDFMPLMQIRRRIGVAAALYAGLHLLIYILDQKWDLIVVALEIVKRFYLTIGFVALLAYAALAITSTDGWQKRLRRNWKRLHWLVYPAVAVAIVHFFIQSKVRIGEPAFTGKGLPSSPSRPMELATIDQPVSVCHQWSMTGTFSLSSAHLSVSGSQRSPARNRVRNFDRS